MTSTPTIEQLESGLERLTAPAESQADIWEQALRSARPHAADRAPLRAASALNQRLPTRPIAIAATIAFVTLACAAFMLPTVGRARHGAVTSERFLHEAHSETLSLRSDFDQSPSSVSGKVFSIDTGGESFEASAVPASPSVPRPARQPTEEPTAARHVVRKAAIDLKTHDVAAAMSKAMFLVSEAGGEYVEASSIHGASETASATLTLRVRAERLSTVLNELRKLGEVSTETAGGEDVTAQVVDLEARLRNERRIELELLELLTRRNDAPLKEVLELRAEINRVRESIERLQAQQDRFSRLVSLATVLVNIRASDAPEPIETGMWTYLTDSVSAAFGRAMRFVIDTVATIVALLIGGAPFWLLIAAAGFAFHAYRKHRRKSLASEPAPAI